MRAVMLRRRLMTTLTVKVRIMPSEWSFPEAKELLWKCFVYTKSPKGQCGGMGAPETLSALEVRNQGGLR